MENAYYSVISPEGCAAILWKDRAKAPEAAASLKLTARNLLEMGLIDEVVLEPMGGAHRDPEAAANSLKSVIKRNLQELRRLTPQELIEARQAKFRKMGLFTEV